MTRCDLCQSDGANDSLVLGVGVRTPSGYNCKAIRTVYDLCTECRGLIDNWITTMQQVANQKDQSND